MPQRECHGSEPIEEEEKCEEIFHMERVINEEIGYGQQPAGRILVNWQKPAESEESLAQIGGEQIHQILNGFVFNCPLNIIYFLNFPTI
jgi:hypothetical protein